MKNKKEETVSNIHDYCIDLDNKIIYLHSIFESEDQGIDHRVANIFLKNFNLLNSLKTDTITIYLNSIGGSWEYGMLIYDIIQSSPKHVKIIGLGDISSMGSIIMQAGDTRITSRNTTWLLHEGSISYSGSYKKTQSYIDFCTNTTDMLYNIYAEKMISSSLYKNKNISEVISMLQNIFSKKDDWFLTGEEAVRHGLADQLL